MPVSQFAQVLINTNEAAYPDPTPPTTKSSSTRAPGWSWWSANLCQAIATTAGRGNCPGSRRPSGATVIADGGYRGTAWSARAGRRAEGQAQLPAWTEEHNTSHRKVRARVEHVFARMKGWKTLRDCRRPTAD